VAVTCSGLVLPGAAYAVAGSPVRSFRVGLPSLGPARDRELEHTRGPRPLPEPGCGRHAGRDERAGLRAGWRDLAIWVMPPVARHSCPPGGARAAFRSSWAPAGQDLAARHRRRIRYLVRYVTDKVPSFPSCSAGAVG